MATLTSCRSFRSLRQRGCGIVTRTFEHTSLKGHPNEKQHDDSHQYRGSSGGRRYCRRKG